MRILKNIEKLVEQLCPDGVEYKSFGEMTTIVRGASPRPIKKYITDRKDGVNWIKIGDVKPGSKYITDVAEKITPEGAQKSRFVKEGDFILSNSMSFGRPYIMKTSGCIHDGWLSISNFSNYFIPDFLYYLLSSNKYQGIMKQKASFGGAVQNLNADIVRELPMPIVPLEVQQEIVRILDQFTQLTAELNEKLDAEQTTRKQQYKYYLNQLLEFEDESIWVELGTVTKSVTTGLNPRRFFKLNTDDASNYYVTIRELQNNSVVFSEKTDRINDEALRLCNNRSNLEIGDILFSGTGTIGETAVVEKTPTNWNIKEGVYSVKPLPEKLNSRFLMYLLHTNKIRTEIFKKVAGGTVKSIPMGELRKLKIPVPPLSEQERLVKLIDRFDALCNDLISGLPAEIAARQKQYEYYRDKLLTFKEKA